MQDFIKKYRKNKLISNIWIIVTSLILAIWINFFLIDWTDYWQNFKANVLNANQKEINSDIYLDLENENIVLKTSKAINNVKSMSLSLIYNPENIEITSIIWNNSNISELSNEEWIKSIIINFENAINIIPNENIIEIITNKNNQGSENLNIINANFTDIEWKNYLLSTSWITF